MVHPIVALETGLGSVQTTLSVALETGLGSVQTTLSLALETGLGSVQTPLSLALETGLWSIQTTLQNTQIFYINRETKNNFNLSLNKTMYFWRYIVSIKITNKGNLYSTPSCHRSWLPPPPSPLPLLLCSSPCVSRVLCFQGLVFQGLVFAISPYCYIVKWSYAHIVTSSYSPMVTSSYIPIVIYSHCHIVI